MLIDILRAPGTLLHFFVDSAGRPVAYITPQSDTPPPDWQELSDWTVTVASKGSPPMICTAADVEPIKNRPYVKLQLRAMGAGWSKPAGALAANTEPEAFQFLAPDGRTAGFRRTETGYYERAIQE